MFSFEFCEISSNNLFTEHLGTSASEISTMGFAIKGSVAHILKSERKNEKLRNRSYFL